MARRQYLGALALCGALACGCAEAPAQEPAKRWEHGVFEAARLNEARGERERFRWITAAGRVEGESVLVVWNALKVPGDPSLDDADQMSVLDHLASQGWELVSASDVSFVLAGGTAIAHRYVFRTRR